MVTNLTRHTGVKIDSMITNIVVVVNDNVGVNNGVNIGVFVDANGDNSFKTPKR